MIQAYTVNYSFRTAHGELAHHDAQSGPANSPEDAVEKVLKHVPQFVRDNLASASAIAHELNRNGDLVRRA
jgi:hypothetical protein